MLKTERLYLRSISIFVYVWLISASLGFFFSCSVQSNDINDITDNLQAETELIFYNYEIKPGMMGIYIFDIGKADAILITTEHYTIMIDAGENKHGTEIADFLFQNNITEIDYLIITHFHKDHVGGADTIIRKFAVKELIVPNYGKKSKQYNQFIKAADKMELEQNILTETIKFTLDDVEFTLYPSQMPYYEFLDIDNEKNEENEDVIYKENDFSIVVSVNHGDNNLLFTGDALTERLRELLLLKEITETKYDFLKVPHHGRYINQIIEFINTVQPTYAVITCSSDSFSFEPADERVIAALEAIGTDVYFTPNGNVYCESNGEDLILSYR